MTAPLSPYNWSVTKPSMKPPHAPANHRPHWRQTLRSVALAVLTVLLPMAAIPPARAASEAELKDLSIAGGVQNGKARLIIEGSLFGGPQQATALYATTLEQLIGVTREKQTHSIKATFDLLQGDPKEFTLTLSGEGEINKVTGEGIQDWSVRQETNGTRLLVIRPRKTDKPLPKITAQIVAVSEHVTNTATVKPLTFAPPNPALLHGYAALEADSELDLQTTNLAGLIPIERSLLPASLRAQLKHANSDVLAFRFQGSGYGMDLNIMDADPEIRHGVLREFRLSADLSEERAAVTLDAVARVRNPKGAVLPILSGAVALADLEQNPRLTFTNGQFALIFDKPGDFPVHLNFRASIRASNDWNKLDFRVTPGAVQPISIAGLASDTQFEFPGAAKPRLSGNNFVSFLPPDGSVKLGWRRAKAATEGKLFYSTEMLSQITVGPGLMRQTALLNFKVMQGELSRVSVIVRGTGNITAVQGSSVLSWNVEAIPNSADRRLVVQLNQAQKDAFAINVQLQSELGAFPQAANALQLRPEGATRFAGHLRIVNDGAVRLEVIDSTGLSQVSPEQFPETESTRALLANKGTQRFVFRFSTGDFNLRLQADNILPEISASELLAYHLGESETTIDAELELEIREAPLRELLLHIPKGYAIARLQAQGLADYFTQEPANQPDGELRLVYSQPVSGRQIVQLRLERNAAGPAGGAADGGAPGPLWALPRIEVVGAKSTRGHIAASADPGFRLSIDQTQGLTDIATAFFPRKLPSIQTAFRISDPGWTASLRVERLAQSVQADAFHLFSIGEGIAYGSSTITYQISGAPVALLRIELSDEYFNVEFTGKDVRNWQKTTNGYVVQLHTPVLGAYTLLATFERPFKGQGDTLTFTGARPLDAQTEQGHTVIVSAYQFAVRPINVSPGLLPLETAEVPAEYRLFFDAPILAAYRYSSRPFNLQLALNPLAQTETLALVVDRAALTTRISKEGEVLTDARYFIKNRGNPHVRIELPAGTTLWSATVNNATVVPIKDGTANLIALPQHADPNAVQVLDLKLASRSTSAKRVAAVAPILSAPVLLAEWKIQPDTGQRLHYRRGSLAPVGGIADISGFAGIARMFSRDAVTVITQLFLAFALVAFAVWVWRWAARNGSYRFGTRQVGGLVLGICAVLLAGIVFARLHQAASQENQSIDSALSLVAPIQQAGSSLAVEIDNTEDRLTFWTGLERGWPALVGLACLVFAARRNQDRVRLPALVAAWSIFAWTALRCPNGAPLLFVVLGLFLLVNLIVPAFRSVLKVPPRTGPAPDAAGAPVTAALLMGGLLLWGGTNISQAQSARTFAGSEPAIAQTIDQQIRVEEKFASSSMKVRWQARKGQTLPLLFEPAVLTDIDYPTNALKLIDSTVEGRRTHQLRAEQEGTYDIALHYQLQITSHDSESGFSLPTGRALVNRLALELVNLDVEISSPGAVSIERDSAVTNSTLARLIMRPVVDTWIGWKPRSRDVKHEKPVFFAEWFQLYTPVAGVVDGLHQIKIRPAQGELTELLVNVPDQATITDVLDASGGAVPMLDGANTNTTSLVSLWRFDPESRKLRITLSRPQSQPFSLTIHSQIATGPLPFEQSAGLLTVSNAANEIGSIGIATGSEVQLDTVTATGLSAMNLEDFPYAILQPLTNQVAGITLRRAFRYTDSGSVFSLKASPVEPDVRVETQQTLSLGEDRTLLAINAAVSITRAGIFRLSFPLPAGYDVESVSGSTLSHWTELNTAQGRIITMHLKGKTDGQQPFAITLSAPGTKAAKGIAVPNLVFREATKQRGQLVVVPEQGMRPQIATRDGITQLDPEKSGIRQKGVLAFRLLQPDWKLTLDVEQVDPWVQVNSLEHATISEAQVAIAANLQYNIENAGLKTLLVRIPTNAENVRFRGDQVADSLPVGPVQGALQSWQVKLHRRIFGKFLLHVTWQTPLNENATIALVHGIQAVDANLQRGFLTVQSTRRLQIRADAPPAALQAAEWQGIPRVLRQDIEASSANFTFRLVEPAFTLPLQLEHHDAAKLLPARVNGVTLTSVVSDEGAMLTQVKLDLVPGDKRLLSLVLPGDARFWFAFVNQNGVWPWREQDRILIPLEQQSRPNGMTTVEFFYSSQIGSSSGRKLDLALLGPKIDLPLENITWRVHLNDKWRLAHWKGTLQLQEQTSEQPVAVDVQSYLQNEVSLNREKTKAAEEMLAMGNTLLERGDPQQARRAFQSAYGLSSHDDAFNEDARVQLHNLKLQQALIGLNVRQGANAPEAEAAKTGNLRDRKSLNYTQQEAKQIIDSNSGDENAALMRLAERLIQQQDAAVASPTAIRAAIPQQGRVLTFRRTVQVDPSAEMRIALETRAVQPASIPVRLLIVFTLFVGIGILLWAAFRLNTKPAGSLA